MKYYFPLIVFIIIMLGTLTACDNYSDYQATTARKNFVNTLEYYQDVRTGLCYAYGNGPNYVVLTNVPCDPVKKYLK